MGDTSKLCECGHEQSKHEGLERLCMDRRQGDWPCVCVVFRPMQPLAPGWREKIESEVDGILSGEAPALPPAPALDAVDHPSHYNSHPAGIECIDVIEHMPFNVGSAIKYLWRAGIKPGADHVEDLKKSAWYANREAERVAKMRSAK